MMCWGGFSARALATKQSSFTRMQGANGDAQRLDPRVSIAEATADGVAPAFQAEGFVRPARVPLIEGGRLVGSLVSPRTAREFGLEANGANGFEGPESLAMAPGTLAAKDALAALGTGLYVGNLHYLNYSDRPAARITGMTRFATFWVEDGRIVAPVDVLRFDDTLFRMLGANLEALTAETELLLASDTYRERQLASMRLPGRAALRARRSRCSARDRRSGAPSMRMAAAYAELGEPEHPKLRSRSRRDAARGARVTTSAA